MAPTAATKKLGVATLLGRPYSVTGMNVGTPACMEAMAVKTNSSAL